MLSFQLLENRWEVDGVVGALHGVSPVGVKLTVTIRIMLAAHVLGTD